MSKVVIIQFPGVNCEYESLRVIEAVGLRGEIRRWNDARAAVRDAASIFIPGGWSYQDRIRGGVVAAKDAVADEIADAVARGVPVLGVCNGAQVLVECGVVPGFDPGAVEVALAPNRMPTRRGYYCAWAHLQKGPAPCVFTEHIDASAILPIPFAHAEGRFATATETVREKLEGGACVALKYITPDGTPATDWPDNPNGTIANIAALTNSAGNALAIMPHPERAAWRFQVPRSIGGMWGAARDHLDAGSLYAPGPGYAVFESLRRALI